MDALAKLSAATHALAEAKTLDDVKHIMDIAEAARTYARAAKLGLEAANHAAEVKLRAERKAGELLGRLEKGDHGGDRRSSSYQAGNLNEYRTVLTESNVATTTAQRWQTVAEVPADIFEDHVATVQQEQRELTSAGVLRLAEEIKQTGEAIDSAWMKVLPITAANHAVSSDPDYDGDEWYTPSTIIESARTLMGGIDIDPASCAAAQKSIRAGAYLTKEDDALRNDIRWAGRMWLNPPYSIPLITLFVDKAISEYEAGNVTEAVILTNNSSDTVWFHALLSRFPACFTRGRVKFWRPNHDAFGARQGQTIFYMGDNVDGFIAEFGTHGQVVTRV
jgi:ParB family chromosome partitioning protein